jgi:PmbA protein
MNRTERLDLARWAMERALKTGADQAAVSINFSRQVDVEFRNKQLDNLQEATRNGLTIQVYTGKRYSVQTTNDLKKESLSQFIADAVAGTKYLAKDDYRSLPDAKYYGGRENKDLRIIDPSHSSVETTDRVKLASAIEAAAMAQSDAIISTTAGCTDIYSGRVLVNSNGMEGELESTSFSAGAEVTVKDGESGRPEDWCYATTRFRSDLPDAEFLGKNAAQRALRKIGQKKIKSGRYEMIVENRTASRLLSALASPMTGRALQQKSSFLDGMLDKKIASEKLTLIDDPFVEKGLASRFFDGEGLTTKKRVLIDHGVLRCFLIDDYYGKKLGMEPTTGSASNIVFDCGQLSLDQLVASVKQGFLVTGFIGGNSNSTTGDFSFGIVGLYIDGGRIVHPVNEMNITGNMKDFWNQLTGLGNDPYVYSSLRCPSMVFKDVNFSGL